MNSIGKYCKKTRLEQCQWQIKTIEWNKNVNENEDKNENESENDNEFFVLKKNNKRK